MARRWRITIGSLVAAVFITCIALAIVLNSCSSNADTAPAVPSDYSKASLSELDWRGRLSDDQKAAVDIAYEKSVESGYEGDLDRWISEKVVGYYNGAGDLVVDLPDGAELVILNERISPSADDHAQSSDGENVGGLSDSRESKLVVDEVASHPGDGDVVVNVSLENNPGVLGLSFAVSYDESALTLIRAENGGAFKNALTLTHSPTLNTGCVFSWDGVEIPQNEVKDGVILVLRFNVSSDAPDGVYPVVIPGNISCFDNDLEALDLTAQNGRVLVQ